MGEELIKPTKIYVKSVLKVLESHSINGMVHNTGGGFIDNIPRVLKDGPGANIKLGSWKVPPIFNFLMQKGEIPQNEIYRTFNMGIGLMVIVDAEKADVICSAFNELGEEASIIGEVIDQLADGLEVAIDDDLLLGQFHLQLQLLFLADELHGVLRALHDGA